LKSFKKDGREPGAGLPSSEKFKFPNFVSFESFKVFESIWEGPTKRTQTALKSAQKRRKKREFRLKFLDILKVRVASGKKLKHHSKLPKNCRKQIQPNFSISVQISSKKDVKNQKSF